jgi:hypothetical protein
VKTIERMEEYHHQARRRHGAIDTIEFVLGDSANELDRIMSSLAQPALLWLDAHAGAGFFGDDEICPLMAELEALNRSPFEHFVFIDDARAFLAPPPPPFDPECWPSIDHVIRQLTTRHDYYVVIVHDVIIATPQKTKENLVRFCNATRPTI